MDFTPCKAEQPLQGMELQEKQEKKDQKIHESRLKRAPPSLLNPFKSLIKRKYSADKEFQSLAVPEKKLLT